MKYYVKSYKFEVVVAGPHIDTPENAVCEAFLKYYDADKPLSPLVIVSERGFEYINHEHSEDNVFDTCEILKKAGFTIEDS